MFKQSYIYFYVLDICGGLKQSLKRSVKKMVKVTKEMRKMLDMMISAERARVDKNISERKAFKNAYELWFTHAS